MSSQQTQITGYNGTVVVYLSGKPAMVSNPQIIFQSQSLRGFWILNWFKSPNPEKIKALYEELAAMVASEVISIPVAGQFSFNQYQEALASRQNTVERRF